jgi:hypothetical protein
MPDFNLMIRQINTRFQWFQIQTIIYTIAFVINSFVDFIRPFNLVLVYLSFLTGTICFIALILWIISLCMLIHGIFNYLKEKYQSPINPTFAVFTIFIPFFNLIRNPVNFLTANKIIGIQNPWAKSLMAIGQLV